MLGQAAHCRELEEIGNRNFPFESLLQRLVYEHEQQRVTAKLEENVVDANLVQLKKLAPDCRDRMFEWCLWRGVRSAQRRT